MANIYTESFTKFIAEINATSGQLRYDPITAGYYFHMKDDEREQARKIILEKLSGDDERIPTLASEIPELDITETLKQSLQTGKKSLPWELSAMHVLHQKESNPSYLDEIINILLNEKISLDIRRLAFSYIENSPPEPNQKEHLIQLQKTVTDIPLKYKIGKYLGLTNDSKIR